MIYRKAKDEWSLLSHEQTGGSISNIPLGLISIAEYEQFDVELDPGDSLLCYTDALIESKDADGEMLGEDGLLRIVRLLTGGDGAPPAGPREITERLLEEIGGRYPENLSEDDTTVLVVTANGRVPIHPLGDQLRAFGRFLKLFFRWLLPGAERPPFPDWPLANLGGYIIPALAQSWRPKERRDHAGR